MKPADMELLLEKVLQHKAVIKELERKAKVLEAQLETAMHAKGKEKLESRSGGVALFVPNTTVKGADIETLLKHFDARTLAGILSGATVNQAKQGFLQRALPDRDFNKALVVERTSYFRVEPPRSEEQKRALSQVIEAAVREQEQNIQNLFEAWQRSDGAKILPDNPRVDEALEEPKKVKKNPKRG